MREALLALRIERAVDKRTILEQWINRAYFGRGAYGIDAAARAVLRQAGDQPVDREAVLLAVVPRAPATYDPIAHLGAARRRRDRVLGLLVRRGVLSPSDARTAAAAPLERRAPPPGRGRTGAGGGGAGPAAREVRARGGVVHTSLEAPATSPPPSAGSRGVRVPGVVGRPGPWRRPRRPRRLGDAARAIEVAGGRADRRGHAGSLAARARSHAPADQIDQLLEAGLAEGAARRDVGDQRGTEGLEHALAHVGVALEAA